MDFKEELKELIFVEKLKSKIREAVKQNQEEVALKFKSESEAKKSAMWLLNENFPEFKLTNDNVLYINLKNL